MPSQELVSFFWFCLHNNKKNAQEALCASRMENVAHLVDQRHFQKFEDIKSSILNKVSVIMISMMIHSFLHDFSHFT